MDAVRKVSKEPLIAIIDDDAPFRVALVEALLSLEYRARGFTSAEEFIIEDRQGACNCVITDIHMPGMSGLDLKRLLTSIGSAVPVIMITARTESDLEARAAASGAVCLLRKPFDIEALLKCLKKALEA
jgi:FixJ family two-component response regulator